VKRELLREAALLVTLAFVPAIAQAVYHRDRVSWQAPAVAKYEVTLAQTADWGDTVMWIDARPDEQFDRQHVPGALLLNEDRWNELLPQMLQVWSPDKRIVVYCSSQSCAASHEVARRLREEAGLENVSVLHGGWEAWLATQK
jgi:rhodanese-related sulfurtransferase